MIFATHGHPVDQQAIVQHVFGGQICAPSGNTLTIVQALSADWVDNHGTPFTSQVTAAYDAMVGIDTLNNAMIVDELSSDRPLIYCNQSHAMVAVAVDYVDAMLGPNIQAVGVLDPFPGAQDFRALSPFEMRPAHLGGQMTFLARVAVL